MLQSYQAGIVPADYFACEYRDSFPYVVLPGRRGAFSPLCTCNISRSLWALGSQCLLPQC